MAIDTFFVFVGTYGDVADAEADYEAIKDLHTRRRPASAACSAEASASRPVS